TVNDALNAVDTAANAGWNVTATGAGSTTANIGPDGTVTFAGDPNLTVTQDGADDAGAVNIALNRNLDVDSVTAGNSMLDTNGLAVDDGTNSATYGANGMAIAGGPSVTAGGIDAGSAAITNVAAGTADTDAVNVAQLNQATQQIVVNEAAIAEVSDRVTVQGESVAQGLGGNSSYNASTGEVTTALNVGETTYSNVNDAINAISATANAGWNIQADGGPATNIASNGTLNVTSGSNVAVSLNGNQLAVAVVDNPTFSGTVTANGGLTVGANQRVDMGGNVVRNVAAGQLAAGSTDAVNGGQLYAVQQVAANSVQYDADGDSVTFNPGSEAIRLQNVAAGVADTDAVNVAQLNSGLLGAVNQANSYTDQRVNALAFDLADTRRDLSAGTAGALAAAGLPQAFEAGKGMLAIGAGTYQGQSAVAMGVSRILDDGKTIIKAGATYNTQSEAGANVGIGFQF
ncbi:MAG: hemagglutinin, partial [Citromicrobium sp.]